MQVMNVRWIGIGTTSYFRGPDGNLYELGERRGV